MSEHQLTQPQDPLNTFITPYPGSSSDQPRDLQDELANMTAERDRILREYNRLLSRSRINLPDQPLQEESPSILANRRQAMTEQEARRSISTFQTEARLDSLQNMMETMAKPLPSQRFKKPTSFAGKADERVDNFIARLTDYFESIKANPDDSISMAASYLEGDAEHWYRAKSKIQPFASWTTFASALRQRFQPLNQERIAYQHYYSCKQTKSVQAYLQTFSDSLLDLPTIPSPTELLYKFYEGLKPQLRILLNISHYSIYEELAKDAMDKDADLFSLKQMATSTQFSPILPKPKPVPSTLTKLTPEKRKYLREHNGCFRCQEINAGHLAKDCPKGKETETRMQKKSINVACISGQYKLTSATSSPTPSLPVSTTINTKLVQKPKKNLPMKQSVHPQSLPLNNQPLDSAESTQNTNATLEMSKANERNLLLLKGRLFNRPATILIDPASQEDFVSSSFI